MIDASKFPRRGTGGRIFVAVMAFLFASCSNTENGKAVNPDAVYFDYSISGEEGKEEVSCLIQYRSGGENGTALVLTSPSQVALDGQLLTVDSSKVNGAYYEAVQPLASFAGKHTISFTDLKKRQYKEEFEFTPFSLAEELPEKLPRKPFSIKLKNYPAGPGVRLVMTDTAFNSGDFNRIVPVENGAIRIDTDMLSGLKDGPLSIELFREEERPVKEGTKKGGKIVIAYGCKRESELVAP
jgi:hypothetical protein